MKKGVIIQARTGSTRMPNKVIQPFYENDTILDIIIQKVLQLDLPIVLATSTAAGDDVLADYAQKYPIAFFRGAEEDVLSRFVGACEGRNFEVVFRVCADNPFISIALLNDLAQKAEQMHEKFDYFSHSYRGTPAILTHFGVFAELVRVTALTRVMAATQDSFYHEHVTNFIYKNPETFKVKFAEVDAELFFSPDIRLTIDTPVDFALAQKIYSDLKKTQRTFDLPELFEYLKKHKPLLAQMKQEIERNSK